MKFSKIIENVLEERKSVVTILDTKETRTLERVFKTIHPEITMQGMDETDLFDKLIQFYLRGRSVTSITQGKSEAKWIIDNLEFDTGFVKKVLDKSNGMRFVEGRESKDANIQRIIKKGGINLTGAEEGDSIGALAYDAGVFSQHVGIPRNPEKDAEFRAIATIDPAPKSKLKKVWLDGWDDGRDYGNRKAKNA